MSYMNKEWTAYLESAAIATAKHKRGRNRIYVSYGSPMYIGYCKAKRELHKQKLSYKFGKVCQAFRILFKLIIRSLSK